MGVSERYESYAAAGPARFGTTYHEPDYYEPEPFYPGERIDTAGGVARRRWRLPWLGIVATVSVCSGVLLLEEGITSPRQMLGVGASVLSSLTEMISQSFGRAPTFAASRPTALPERPGKVAELPPIEERPVTQIAVVSPTIVNPPQPEQQAEPGPTADAPASDSTTPASPASSEPLPRPVAVAPYQKRAEAVGLHPGLSRALLSRLTKTDYRNARFAIKTALAKTSDRDVFVWPRKTQPELAMFQVRFVPGAPSNCRRYIVEIAKDGWLTTARPMEKCGIKVSSLARRN